MLLKPARWQWREEGAGGQQAAGGARGGGLARGQGRPGGSLASSTGCVGRSSRIWEWERTWLPAEWDCPPHHHRLSDSEAAQRAASAALCSLSSAPPDIICSCSRSIGRSAPRTRTSRLAPRASYPIRSAPPTASPPTRTTSYNFYNLLLQALIAHLPATFDGRHMAALPGQNN